MRPMRPMHRLAALSAALLLAACSGGSSAQTSAPGGTAAAKPCDDSTGTTVVAASVKDNTWSQPVNARVNDVITWTNNDGVPHKVVLDDSSCGMKDNIPGGGSKSLVFTKAGTYPFHCSVHPSMKGTITITAS
ncbi:MAG: cupredoxin domain-containing protein [Chloroflexi bacterium]|nr:cupredoxin domain-containing protein [Chloroflexota bacterium]